MQIAIFQFDLFGINTYLIWDPDTKEAAVVDPGMSSRQEEEAIENFIAEKGLSLRQVINTHLHIDHIAGIPFFQKKYNAKVLAHQGDEFMATGMMLKAQNSGFGLNLPLENIEISEYLKGGDTIQIGHEELKVLEVPGHSHGSIALYDPKGKWVITGDALFNGSIGRTDLPGGNYKELISSIESELLSLPDDTVVYPGHGPATTIGNEKHSNPFLT